MCLCVFAAAFGPLYKAPKLTVGCVLTAHTITHIEACKKKFKKVKTDRYNPKIQRQTYNVKKKKLKKQKKKKYKKKRTKKLKS